MIGLRRQVPVVLGLFGVGIGLLYFTAILTWNGDGCSCGWHSVQVLFGGQMLIASIIGLTGTLLSLRSQRTGGTLLIAGALILILPILLETGFWQVLSYLATSNNSTSYLITSILFYGAIFLPGLLFLVAGLVTIPKTRHTIKTLLRKLSERYYGFLET